MKLLYITDLHFRAYSPKSRTDDYLQALLKKLGEVASLAEQHQARALLIGGDLFESPDVANSVIAAAIRALKRMRRPVYGIAGNHDLYGGSLAAIGRTALEVVAASGAMTLLDPGKPAILEEAGVRVQLTGQPYHPEMDRRDWRRDYSVYNDTYGFKPEEHQHFRRWNEAEIIRYSIHMVHGMLRTAPFGPGVPAPVTLVQDVLNDTFADLTLSGHDHIGFGIVRHPVGRQQWACNPGALMRKDGSRAEFARQVQVALITADADNLSVELIPLATALPAEQILDRSHLDEEAAKEQARERLMAGLAEDGEFTAVNVAEVVQQVADRQHVRPEVRQEALERIQKAQEAAAQGEEVGL